jgi:large subunit ribosomal protein L15
MKLHQLPSSHKRSQRIGRGGKRGTSAGRGTKGQRSRSGHRIRPAERDLIMRIPKLRGFRNKPKRDASKVFSLDDLAAALKSYATGKEPVALTKEFLVVAGLLGKNFKGTLKILGDGAITTPVAVSGIMVSASAKAKIEKAGGSIK